MSISPDLVADTPGGEMKHRPLHFIWMLDCSSSMESDGKIAQLNFAIRETIPEMRRVADDNPKASLLVRVLTFSTGAQWHVERPTSIEDFIWADVQANGVTDLGKALELVAAQLDMPPMPERALPPVLALVSDGQPTDDWKSALQRLDKTPWGKKAVRVSIAIGQDANKDVLKQFLDNPEIEPLEANNPAALVRAIRFASTAAVRVASEPKDAGPSEFTAPAAPIPTTTDDDEIW